MTDTLDQVSAGIDSKKFHWEFNSAGLTLSPSLSDFIWAEYTEAEAIYLIRKFHDFYHKLWQRIKKAEWEDLVVLMRVYNDLADANNAVLKYAGRDYQGLSLIQLEWLVQEMTPELVEQVSSVVAGVFEANESPDVKIYITWSLEDLPDLRLFPQILSMSPKMAQEVLDQLMEYHAFLQDNREKIAGTIGVIKFANFYNDLVCAYNYAISFLPKSGIKRMVVISAHELEELGNIWLKTEHDLDYLKTLMAQRGN